MCAVAAAALMVLLVACGSGLISAEHNTPTASPTSPSTTSRSVRNEPVTITETHATADSTAQDASAEDSNIAENDPASASSTESITTDTPDTGDGSIIYLIGVLGLIFICSAGLVMLKRI